MMTEPGKLSDEDLLDRAHQLRLLALRGHVEASGPAHDHEREVRRRFDSHTTMNAGRFEGLLFGRVCPCHRASSASLARRRNKTSHPHP